MKEKPSYYAILTAEVRYDNQLSDSEKLLFAEITALTNNTGECWASNNYFAELYGVSTRSIIRRIQALVERKYITSTMIYRDGSKEVEKRIIRLVGPDRDVTTPPDNFVTTPPDKSVTDNTTSFNNTSINIKEISEKIDFLYGLYPAKCPVRISTSLGKTQKNKDKIRLVITKRGELNNVESLRLEATIRRYVRECISTKTWLKGFGTFLNNLPDYQDLEIEDRENGIMNSFGTLVPQELPQVKNKSELNKDMKGIVNVMGENWYYDMELCEWITVEQGKNKKK